MKAGFATPLCRQKPNTRNPPPVVAVLSIFSVSGTQYLEKRLQEFVSKDSFILPFE